MTKSQTTALILAAGEGSRFGSSRPKQLVELCGHPVFSYALHQHLAAGHAVIVVVSNATRRTIADYLGENLSDARVTIVDGGETRRQSLLSAIRAIPDGTPPQSCVLLRNSASPNTSIELVDAVVAGLEIYDGVQAYIPSHATAFMHRGGELVSLYEQSSMGFTVDPTGYRLELLRRIGRVMESEATGSTSLDVARTLGARIGLVESPRSNIKVTNPEDLDRLGSYMSASTDAPLGDPTSANE